MIAIRTSRAQTFLKIACLFATATAPILGAAQETKKTDVAKPADKNPAQIELLETKVRFETNGDSRKEVHTRVRINSEVGAHQFVRLNFDFNRSFQSVEIPLVRVTHESGGTADILPSAITDNPNPAVVDFPAYHDVRVKSVRILGLAPGDLLEYRVITTTTHHPLAPDFWLDHTFERSGLVSEELFELSLPALPRAHLYASPAAPVSDKNEEPGGRVTYQWRRRGQSAPQSDHETETTEPAVVVSTYDTWQQLVGRLAPLLAAGPATLAIHSKAGQLVATVSDDAPGGPTAKIQAIYDFVSQKIRTVDLSLGATGFKARSPEETLSAGYGTPEDKFRLFSALCVEVVTRPKAGLVSTAMPREAAGLARPSVFDHLLTLVGVPSVAWWTDLNLEVAPFGMVPSRLRRTRALVIDPSTQDYWLDVSSVMAAAFESQHAESSAAIGHDGTLRAKVHYSLRGDNELLLRVAFHKTEKEKWKDIAQMLSLSDGFRGQITNVTASDPYATKDPFTIEYEISQPKFVDWSKKTARVPAILPLPGLPDAPTAEQIKSGKPIDLGTPLTIELESTVELPAGATAQAPIGTSVTRDYATFASKYSVEGNKLHASRSLHFVSSELPAARAADLSAFLHAVQSDQTQLFSVQAPPQK